MKNQVFLPTVAEFPNDIAISWELQKPLVDADYMPGLMLFIRKSDAKNPRVLNAENVKKQYDNLLKIAEQYGHASIITMLPNMPIGDIDFLHNSGFATEHVLAGINFAKKIPIGGQKILTFHLNPLGNLEEFKSKSREQWYAEFDRVVQPRLEEIAREAKRQNVSVLVETLGVPEFGDMKSGEGESYNCSPDLRGLRSPFYIFGENYIAQRIRNSGLGLCLDLCHNRTIYQVGTDDIDIIFEEDKERIRNQKLSLMNDVEKLKEGDIVHLNDGNGKYTIEGGVYKEGVALGDGDISNLPEIIKKLKKNMTPIVFEINETDFKERPNTRKSIEYFLSDKCAID